jgi:hypothetical protein
LDQCPGLHCSIMSSLKSTAFSLLLMILVLVPAPTSDWGCGGSVESEDCLVSIDKGLQC